MYRRSYPLLAATIALVTAGANVPGGLSGPSLNANDAMQSAQRSLPRSPLERLLAGSFGVGTGGGRYAGRPGSSPNGGRKRGQTKGRRHASLRSRSRRQKAAARAKRA